MLLRHRGDSASDLCRDIVVLTYLPLCSLLLLLFLAQSLKFDLASFPLGEFSLRLFIVPMRLLLCTRIIMVIRCLIQ